MRRILTLLLLICLISISFSQENTQSSSNSSALIQNLTISVTIGGDFPITGTFPAAMNERVDQFVTRMYLSAHQNAYSNIKELTPEVIKAINDKLNNYTLRGIMLKRLDGEVKILDLLKFRINGDFSNNPYLKNDDVLIFPAADSLINFFTITGAVNSPGKFYYVKGDKLSDALELAQGINKAYENVTDADIDRLSYDGETMKTIKVKISDNFSLERGDRIRVLADETQKKDFKVEVIGEVKMPGEIPIKKDGTTLSEVIKEAGGFTKQADLSRAQLIRGVNVFKSILFSDQLEQLQNLRMSTLKNEDSIYFKIDEQLRLLRGNGNIDFTKLEDPNFSDTLFFVKDGDVIYIPPQIDLVYVYGQVNNPGYVKFEKNQDMNYYVNQAGGLGETSNDIYLIKGKTRSWNSEDEVKDKKLVIEPGDFIWVSKNPIHDFWYHVDQASRLAVVISSIATLAVLIYQLKH